MNIYINKRLFSLPIINQLGCLLTEYNKEAKTASENTLNSYKDWLCQDPVAVFLDYIVNGKLDNKEDIVRYLTEWFYVAKGTEYITAGLKKWNDSFLVQFDEVTLANKKITVKIEDKLPDTLDFDDFCSKIINFFSALLFYNEIEITINTINIKVEDKSTPEYAIGEIEYEYDTWKDSESESNN